MRPGAAAAGWVARLFLVALLLACAACEAHVDHACTLYTQGRLVDAAAAFDEGERDLGRASPRERARYGLYRGLTLLDLGEVSHAQRWLGFARDEERAHPGALGAEQRAALDHGWATVTARLGASPPRAAALAPGAASAPGRTTVEQRSLVP